MTIVVLNNGVMQEVCYVQDFIGQCAKGDLILVKSALLGRMKLGQCLDRDFGYLGCHQNVISKLDELCSGKNQCRIQKMSKQDFDEVLTPSTCPNGLELFLEADYECFKALDTSKVKMDSIGVGILMLFTVVLVGFSEIALTDALQEVCNAEDFNAQCGRGEIIVMKSANLGRMRLGKCISQDFGYIGCQSSVVSKLDTVCTGKNECKMKRVAKRDFEDLLSTDPCPDGLELFLEAEYECMRDSIVLFGDENYDAPSESLICAVA
ncbi:hypothetical protein CAPTEDRAFT_197658 [Capitella teleta]|uniref:SUEL-type lectin domain-containing protein n=1 Tax=Capitella teleta TaxID=283909 RepID=R7VGP4_CAPTE|nr:hypothetical protein CAPTEDRAFT_197658 [Capitella teleta]|eukprot:ELU18018.1 hypothetical protein CAPTEDRAFT_197658 [Capitella teleta]